MRSGCSLDCPSLLPSQQQPSHCILYLRVGLVHQHVANFLRVTIVNKRRHGSLAHSWISVESRPRKQLDISIRTIVGDDRIDEGNSAGSWQPIGTFSSGVMLE